MKLLRDFHCDFCGETSEKYIDSETRQATCVCGETANRVIGMPRVALDGTDPAYPTAYDRWANVREANRAHKQNEALMTNSILILIINFIALLALIVADREISKALHEIDSLMQYLKR